MTQDAYFPVETQMIARGSRLAESALVIFLLLVFVGLSPFHPPPPDTGVGLPSTGVGDAWRQISYIGVFALIVLCALRQKGLAAITSVPVLLLALLGWCLLSALWAAEPDVAFRRAGLATIVVLSTMLSVGTIGSARALILWRWVLGLVLVVNFLSIPFIPEARHIVGESDLALVGNWRGLYHHKNIAGAVSAITALVFLFAPGVRRKWLSLAFFVAAVVFVVMTKSKTSLVLLVIGVAAGTIYRWAWARDIDRMIVVIAVLMLALGVAVFMIADAGLFVRFISDPDEFTGRTEIWRAQAAYFADHLFLGSGFGTFADTGGLSPLHGYVAGWAENVSHGHNGYLQILVTIGGVGFVLTFLSLIVGPALEFWRHGPEPARKALLFTIFVFVVLHNFLESDYLESDGATWVSFLLMLAMLRNDRSLRA